MLHKEKAMQFLAYPKKDSFFFQVNDPYFGLKVNSFQQREINIYLRASLFQQEDFDMRMSLQLQIAKEEIWHWYFDVRLYYGLCA